MADEWGPWTEHDGKGYPVPIGTYVHALQGDQTEYFGYVTHNRPDYNTWSWYQRWFRSNPQWATIRYRIRRPKALQQLIDMVENLPVDERIKEDA